MNLTPVLCNACTLLLFPSPLSHLSCLVKFAQIKIALAAWIRLNPVVVCFHRNILFLSYLAGNQLTSGRGHGKVLTYDPPGRDNGYGWQLDYF